MLDALFSLTLAATPIGPARVEPACQRHLTVKATAAVDRKRFGVCIEKLTDKGGHLVGDQVNVELAICLVEAVG